jgi:hypothetical protein
MSLLGEVGVFDRVIQARSARHRQAGFIMVMYVGWWWWWWWCFYFGSNNNQQSKISVELEHRQYSSPVINQYTQLFSSIISISTSISPTDHGS